MLVRAALVPETVLLVPGAAGRAAVLEDERAAALTAVETLLAAGPDAVVVAVPGPVPGVLRAATRTSFAAVGVPTAARAGAPGARSPLPDPAHVASSQGAGPVADVGASVLVHLLHEAGWTRPVDVLVVPTAGSVARDADAADAALAVGRAWDGREATAGPEERVALLLGGSLSARHGPDAPLADDPRAAPLDAELVRDLVAFDAGARGRLAGLDAALADALAISAWASWQVLLHAAPPGTRGRLLHEAAPSGAAYAVVVWDVP
ncbi:hypothetical protein Q9R32_08275 [Actinotalea sp. AC32]|nr:hypothetical protein [Actinotalea sp. AC32]